MVKITSKKILIPAFIAIALLFVFVAEPNAESLNGEHSVSKIISEFYSRFSDYEQVMLKAARQLFYWCAILEIAYLGWKAALGATDIGTLFKNFCLSLAAAGFFLAVIHNYHEWAWNIINGLQKIAGEATSLVNASDEPFSVGLELSNNLFEKTGLLEPINSFAYILAGMAILICFSLITLQMIFIKCECMVAMCASAILLGLGATSFFRDYAINSIRYIFAVAFKLMTMQLVMGVGISFIRDLKITDNDSWLQIGVTICFCIIFYALVKTLPDIVAGIIQGAHVGSGSAMSSTMAAAGGAVAGAAAGALVGANTVRLASTAAGMQGKTGMGMIAGTVSNLAGAGLDAMHKRSARAGTTSSVLREQIMQHKADAEAAAMAERMRQQTTNGDK
ncbi:MAG: P-type conjugative transfer protein TrbL [Desulfovibrio sp.]|uniref:P-type conjugative transfer protein TrbL n=1 Tax=Desulfovibrio sp. TaxID=885 RepID=UPI0025B88256|nr:P-type conjugative transfer protein TrbL [Desulfovibrio sp.]MCI7568972.1 P-type conjugative transfer protein TrbL [Desulfovibrio sp.]